MVLMLIAAIVVAVLLVIQFNGFGSLPSEPQHQPWHATIYHQYNTSLDPINQCGGTLINTNSILTAAHCVCIENENEPLDTQNIFVYLGQLNLDVYENINQSFQVNFVTVLFCCE